MNVEQETLGFRRGSLSLPLSLLMSAFALLIPPASLTRHLRRPTERSPTISALLLEHAQVCRSSHSVARTTNLQLRGGHLILHFPTVLSCVVLRHLTDFQSVRSSRNLNALKGALKSAASVHGLSPVTSSAQDDSISELLRFL
jgi:hypothetical protein